MTYLSPLLSRHGAVPGSGRDAGVAAHYGDPMREQRALAGLRGSRGVVDFSHRAVLTVAGPDRLSWLNTLSSQSLLGLRPGNSSETLFLTIQGRIEFAAQVVDDGETTWLSVETAGRAGLLEWLNKMRFALRVDITDVSDDWAILGATQRIDQLESPAPSTDAAPLSGALVWQDPWPNLGPGGFAYTATEDSLHPGRERPWFEYYVPTAALEDTVARLEVDGWVLAGTMASEALRIAAWRPRFGAETDEKSIPHELDLIRTAVHLEKGCYKGQETVARVHNLGHPPRRLVFLQLDGSLHTLPAEGSEVVLGERTVGRVTSVAQHFEMGAVALAVIKRNVDPDVELSVKDAEEMYPAAQEAIVATNAGAVVGRRTGFLKGPR